MEVGTVKQEVKEEGEAEWKVGYCQGTIVQYNDFGVLVGWQVWWGDFLQILGTEIHRAIMISKQTLPITTKVPMWESMGQIFTLHFSPNIQLVMKMPIAQFLGKWS
jgi:hypothetical protein